MKSEDIPGWMDNNELNALREIAASLPPKATWVEVGVFCGRSAHAVALALPQGANLVLVDDYRDQSDLYKVDPPAFDQVLVVMEDIRSKRPDINIFGWTTDSTQAAKRMTRLGDRAAVVFIDADHSYEAVQRDCLLWRPLADLLIGHDYRADGRNPGVKQAIDELYKGDHTVYEGTSIWKAPAIAVAAATPGECSKVERTA